MLTKASADTFIQIARKITRHVSKHISEDFRMLRRVASGLIALFVLAIVLTVWALRSDAIRDAENDTGNIAVVLSGQIARSIQSVDIILSDVRDQTKAQGTQTPNETDERIRSHDFYESLRGHLNRLTQADVIALIDNTGRVANSTSQWPRQVLTLPTANISSTSRMQATMAFI